MRPTVETSDEESLLDSEVVFERKFVFGAGGAECLRSLDGTIAVLHVLRQTGVGPFSCLGGFHVLIVSNLEAKRGFTNI